MSAPFAPARRLALVTGASTGFGKGLTAALLANGWEVLAALRGASGRAELLAAEAAAHPGRLHLLDLDVAEPAQRKAAAARVDAMGGRLELLVNNAGYGQFGALEDLSEEQLRWQFEVNFFGAALLTRELLPALRTSRGKVLNVSSILGLFSLPLAGAYCASKRALEGLSESLAFELEPHGVQVCAVEPGGFGTRFNSNLMWGVRSRGEDSPYQAQTEGYVRMRERLIQRRTAPPERVVEAMLKLAEARRIPRRLLVGRDARSLSLLHALLPDAWVHRLLARVYGRAMGPSNS
jgi:NAD(P)-dependent dehydrogenase (short-subunit alcohol dehydrogenase family)